MDLQKNDIFTQDMRQIGSLPLMEELRGRTVLVTGATGLIGQTIVSALLRCGETDAEDDRKKPVHVFAGCSFLAQAPWLDRSTDSRTPFKIYNFSYFTIKYFY